MSDDRHSNGTFIHLPGASSSEQSRYGVNAHDSEHTARAKVLYGQSQETSTYVEEPFSVGTRRFFFVVIALIVILVGGLSGAKHWQELGLKTSVYYTGAAYFEPFEAAQQRKRVHAYVLERIKPLYRDNAPLARIFSYCTDGPGCKRPDGRAYDAFQKYALDPARYQSQVCDFEATFGDSYSAAWKDWPREWRLSKDRAYCELVNVEEIKRKFFFHNLKKLAPRLLAMGAILLALYGMFRVSTRS